MLKNKSNILAETSPCWYFLNTKVNDGSFNMSCDLLLLNRLFEGVLDLPLLRVYGWNESTYSIGANQKYTEPHLSEHPVVKRISGGQAVLHGNANNELTYSIVIKCQKNFKKLYEDIGELLILFLSKYGLRASIGYSKQSYLKTFNCFDSKTPADIVVNDIKIIGSAQYRKKDCILQHGSIKLDLIRKLSQKELSFEMTAYDLKSTFERLLKIKFIDYSLVTTDCEKINYISAA
ncbi:MAG: lipoate--protein ligase family protein [Candidatus Melainabacteria bacterium]|nr:lipoate--protein ligase family protein [Candidatus Melainabacteria bacterium]